MTEKFVEFVEGDRVVWKEDGVPGTVALSEPYLLGNEWIQTVMTGSGGSVWVVWDDGGESGWTFVKDLDRWEQ